jgi:hypothetical protein
MLTRPSRATVAANPNVREKAVPNVHRAWLPPAMAHWRGAVDVSARLGRAAAIAAKATVSVIEFRTVAWDANQASSVTPHPLLQFAEAVAQPSAKAGSTLVEAHVRAAEHADLARGGPRVTRGPRLLGTHPYNGSREAAGFVRQPRRQAGAQVETAASRRRQPSAGDPAALQPDGSLRRRGATPSLVRRAVEVAGPAHPRAQDRGSNSGGGMRAPDGG